MNENKIYTKESLRGSRRHRLTGWSEQKRPPIVHDHTDIFNSKKKV
jgi:hypothetical protein